MGDVHIRPNGAGRATVQAGGGGGHVSMGPGTGTSARYVPNGKWDVLIYDTPGARVGAAKSNNPGLAAALLSPQMQAVVADYAAKVAATYRASLTTRGTGVLASTVVANVNPNDGFDSDRWVGTVTVGSAAHPYGAADEFGRKNPDGKQRGSTTDGSHALRNALYSVLPYPI